MKLLRKLWQIRSDWKWKLKQSLYEMNNVWRHQYKIDLGIAPKWSLGEKIKYNRRGFTNEDYYNFDLKNNDYRDYISYRERLRLENVNGRFAYILGEKLMFERIFGPFIHVPHIRVWVKNRKFYDLDAGKETDLLSVLKESPTLIAKPTRSNGGGFGIHKISLQDETLSVDGKPVSYDELCKKAASWAEYIFVDYVHQAEYSRRIFSETTNSIRVVTALRKSGEIEVLFAFHRFGSEMSKPVDNISSGGMVALIDTATGRLGKAKRKTEPTVFHTAHPDSNVQIEGVVIPNWEGILNQLIHVHHCFRYYTFLAWDVVVGEDGEPYILEINRGSDLGIQMIQPMRNEKMGEFMGEYGLLDKR